MEDTRKDKVTSQGSDVANEGRTQQYVKGSQFLADAKVMDCTLQMMCVIDREDVLIENALISHLRVSLMSGVDVFLAGLNPTMKKKFAEMMKTQEEVVAYETTEMDENAEYYEKETYLEDADFMGINLRKFLEDWYPDIFIHEQYGK